MTTDQFRKRMGQGGCGLYSGDFALDLRSTITALLPLPFSPDRIAECESEPSAANDAADEDHTTFWLVIADQFAKRGVACERVRDEALAIIDTGQDVATMRILPCRAFRRAWRQISSLKTNDFTRDL
jgi:hypothetical protein